MSLNSQKITYILLLIALGGYVSPWVLAPSAPLSLNAYDLAEWASLHPSQPSTSPALVVPLLLRIQLVIIAVMIGLHARTYITKWIAFITIALLSVAQLPPLEFLTIATDNINYQQQFILATSSLIIGTGLVVKSPERYSQIISICLMLGGIATSFIGLQQARDLYTMSLQEQTIGTGILISVSAYAILHYFNFAQVITGQQDTRIAR